jgi:hypothetical protein
MWHTPLRQENRAGTSQASASSRMLAKFCDQLTVIPLRANETGAPVRGYASGKCGVRCGAFVMSGLIGGNAPNSSL